MALTQEEIRKISRDAWEAKKNPIIECKNAVRATDLTGLAWCEDLNEKYIQYAPLKSLQMEIDKCIEERSCDPGYILEKMRLLTCHLADLYRMTAYEEPYKTVCADYRKYYESPKSHGH